MTTAKNQYAELGSDENPVLMFPTHYLGNFVLGLPWVLRVAEDYPTLTLVIDERFRELTEAVVPTSIRVIEYPRQKLKQPGSTLTRLGLYLGFLRRLRKATGGVIIDMEGERFSGVLCRLSGAKNRYGPTGKNAQHFYNTPRELDYYKHRYTAFGEILDVLVTDTAPSNVLPYQLPVMADVAVEKFLARHDIEGPFVVIHPGASAAYKLWPVEHFVKLFSMLEGNGLNVVWIGAGNDTEMIDAIAAAADQQVIHFDLLGYLELVALFKRARFYIGGDSGPMHLAASAGLDLVALFGPSKEAIWAPLGKHSRVLRGTKSCGKDCDAWQCEFGYHCLSSLIPEVVFGAATATRVAIDMREPALDRGYGDQTQTDDETEKELLR
ncbi:MAG: glycosyltransferase family 9 protein [Gammaproteobacteria bacterium]|jgi:ADP-heptose:LPS heptosyltransferase|nr:glycosyltransferase family 9 protein [Gammaproteobacteria bacterium]